MKKWFNSKEKLFSLIIALIITFAYVNLLFSIIEKIQKFSWITEIVVTVLLVSFVALVIIGLIEDGDRFRVIINKSNINILRLIVILLIAFSLSYIVILLTTGTEFLISHLSTNGIWGIITLIFSLLLFWFGIMKKIQILEVKVSVSGNKFKDELPLLTSDDELKVRVLCDGKNTDIVKFQGFCLSTEIDKIENSINKNWKDIILLPKYSNGQLLITSEEQVKPHELSSEYVISRRSIINTLNELKKEDIQKNLKDGCIKLYTLYTDSNGIYFSKLILLKYDNIKMDENKKITNNINEVNLSKHLTKKIVTIGLLIIGPALMLEALIDHKWLNNHIILIVFGILVVLMALWYILLCSNIKFELKKLYNPRRVSIIKWIGITIYITLISLLIFKYFNCFPAAVLAINLYVIGIESFIICIIVSLLLPLKYNTQIKEKVGDFFNSFSVNTNYCNFNNIEETIFNVSRLDLFLSLKYRNNEQQANGRNIIKNLKKLKEKNIVAYFKLKQEISNRKDSSHLWNALTLTGSIAGLFITLFNKKFFNDIIYAFSKNKKYNYWNFIFETVVLSLFLIVIWLFLKEQKNDIQKSYYQELYSYFEEAEK